MRQTKRLWTTSKDQAIRFLKTSIAKAFANGSIKENQDYGYLSIFQLRPSPELSTYAFDDANVEWLHCVAAHRKRLLFLDVEDTMAKYDIIAGKIADGVGVAVGGLPLLGDVVAGVARFHGDVTILDAPCLRKGRGGKGGEHYGSQDKRCCPLRGRTG